MIQYKGNSQVTPKSMPHSLRQRRTLMKKLLSLLLALTMLILPCAFAESAEDAENTEATEEIEVQLVEDAMAGLRYNLPAD